MVVHCSVAEEVTKPEYETSKDSVTAGSYGVVMWYVIHVVLDKKNMFATESIFSLTEIKRPNSCNNEDCFYSEKK